MTGPCEICCFLHETILFKGSPQQRTVLECRKNAPECCLKNEEESYGCWPIVKPNDWCGEWE